MTFEWKQRGGTVWKHGGTWEGIIPQLMASYRKAAAGPRRMQLEKYMSIRHCDSCKGARLNPQARFARVAGVTLVELESWPMGKVCDWLNPQHGGLSKGLSLSKSTIASELLKEIRGRVQFLMDVGLHYLTLDRSAPTLSGGETQRIRLAGQIGCGLVGVLYILDEPSIGLHPRDNDRLIQSLLRLRDLGNTVIVVEHDEDAIRTADYILDMGPGAGVHGGEVVARGTLDEILKTTGSVTADYLNGTRQIDVPKKRRKGTGKKLTVENATANNLRGVTASIPLGTFTCITGVSGSGKSSFTIDTLYAAAARQLNGARMLAGKHDRITGLQYLDKVIDIDQSPIGRTPRSNPATYRSEEHTSELQSH